MPPSIRLAPSGERHGGSNGSQLPGGWLKVTCGLTAFTPGSAPGPTLGNEYRRILPFLPYSQFIPPEVTQLDRPVQSFRGDVKLYLVDSLSTYYTNKFATNTQQIEPMEFEPSV